jgi:sulfur-carrier protein
MSPTSVPPTTPRGSRRELPASGRLRVTVRIPAALQPFSGGLAAVPLELDEGATMHDLFEALGERHPDVVRRVLDEAGRQRADVHVFVGPDSIRALKGLETPLVPFADVAILPPARRPGP